MAVKRRAVWLNARRCAVSWKRHPDQPGRRFTEIVLSAKAASIYRRRFFSCTKIGESLGGASPYVVKQAMEGASEQGESLNERNPGPNEPDPPDSCFASPRRAGLTVFP